MVSRSYPRMSMSGHLTFEIIGAAGVQREINARFDELIFDLPSFIF